MTDANCENPEISARTCFFLGTDGKDIEMNSMSFSMQNRKILFFR